MKPIAVLPLAFVALVVIAGSFTPRSSRAEDLPRLQAGMWSYQRMVDVNGKPQSMTKTECADPTARMKQTNAAAASRGCKMSPLVRNGNRYTFTFRCTNNGVEYSSRSVMTVISPTAYRVDVEAHGPDGKTQKETLTAKRIGDCPK